MSENQHKCKLTGMELQQEYLKTQGYDSRITPEGCVEVYVTSENIPEFKVTVPFKYFAEWGNVYWNALKEYPIDVIHYNIDNTKTFDVVLFNTNNMSVESWNFVTKDQLEETILQAVVTHHNLNKYKEEQT
jgi:hypothetical protein